jgi:hypothetical protein
LEATTCPLASACFFKSASKLFVDGVSFFCILNGRYKVHAYTYPWWNRKQMAWLTSGENESIMEESYGGAYFCSVKRAFVRTILHHHQCRHHRHREAELRWWWSFSNQQKVSNVISWLARHWYKYPCRCDMLIRQCSTRYFWELYSQGSARGAI